MVIQIIVHGVYIALQGITCLQHTMWHRNFLEEERISKYVILISLLRMVRCVKSTWKNFNPAPWRWGMVSTDHLHVSSSNSIGCVIVPVIHFCSLASSLYLCIKEHNYLSFTRAELFWLLKEKPQEVVTSLAEQHW